MGDFFRFPTGNSKPGKCATLITAAKETNVLFFVLFFTVTGAEDNHNMLEGILRGKKGLFPTHCVQEVRLRNPNSVRQAITTAPRAQTGLDNSNLSSNHIQQRHFATAQRAKDAM